MLGFLDFDFSLAHQQQQRHSFGADMKKVINDATNVVDDMIEGLVASHRGVLARVGRLPVIVHATPLAAEVRSTRLDSIRRAALARLTNAH